MKKVIRSNTKLFFHLNWLYLKFLQRKIFNNSFLSNKLVRLYILILITLVYALVLILQYGFFQNSPFNETHVKLFVQIYSQTIYFMMLVLYILLKQLFSSTKNFLKITEYLPLTPKFRNISFYFLEVEFIMLSMLLYVLPTILILVFKFGHEFLVEIIAVAIFQTLTYYLLFELLYSVIKKVIKILKISEFGEILFVFVFVTIMYVSFFYSKSYVNVITTSYFSNVAYPSSYYNFWILNLREAPMLSTISFLGFVILVPYISIKINPFSETSSSTVNYYMFLDIHSEKKFKYYIYGLVRRTENILIMITTFLIFGFTLVYNYSSQQNTALYSLIYFTSFSLFSFHTLKSIMKIEYSLEKKSIKVYWHLISAQIVYYTVVTTPFLLVSLLLSREINTILLFYIFSVQGIILFTNISILFGNSEENPFSIYISIIILLVAIIFISIIMIAINLNDFEKLIVVFILTIITCIISIKNLKYALMS